MHPVLEFRHAVFAFVALVLAMAWQCFDWRGFKPVFGAFEIVAPISYGLYVLHFPIITLLATNRSPATLALTAIACIAAAALAELAYQHAAVRLIDFSLARLGPAANPSPADPGAPLKKTPAS
jgi:peptidoglycan/LPS O-acetylase OafA/YrhL